MSWLVGRFEPGDIPWSMVEEFAAYIRSLGLDPTHMALRAAVVEDAGSGYKLHLMRYLLNDDGCEFLNAAANQPVWESVIVPVAKDSWPQWLPGMGCAARQCSIELWSDGSGGSETEP